MRQAMGTLPTETPHAEIAWRAGRCNVAHPKTCVHPKTFFMQLALFVRCWVFRTFAHLGATIVQPQAATG